MRISKNIAWIFYIGDISTLDKNKIGKWMYFFNNKQFVSQLCYDAVEKGIVVESKHSNAETGVACFYINCDDIKSHKKVITYFIENNLINKTKAGSYYNISFKLDSQTRNGEYGKDFHAKIRLADFIDLNTGEWK